MSETRTLEEQVRDVLRTESDAIRLSDALFRPDGLFARMASSKEERRELAKSPLFQQAQNRLAELRRLEAQEFSKAVEESAHGANPPERFHRSERI